MKYCKQLIGYFHDEYSWYYYSVDTLPSCWHYPCWFLKPINQQDKSEVHVHPAVGSHTLRSSLPSPEYSCSFASQIGTGFSDEQLEKHTEFFGNHIIEAPKAYYRCSDGVQPDQWFDSVQVSDITTW